MAVSSLVMTTACSIQIYCFVHVKYFLIIRFNVHVDMNFKNLQRIFPVDDTMVMIVDDRVDVWGACKNLIKIEPCMSSQFVYH